MSANEAPSAEKAPLPEDLVREIETLAPRLGALSHYGALQIAEGAGADEIKAGYFRMTRRFHPDRWHAREVGAHRKRMEAIFARASEAYAVLGNTATKQTYDAAAGRASAPPAARQGPARPRIIVAEDDDALRAMIVRVLEDIGDVVEGANGAAALAHALEGPRPSLVLTDVMMPTMDGLELARRLRALPEMAHVPILMLTAKTRPMDVVDGINAGARSYITKPFKVDELRARVKKALGIRDPPT